MDKFMLDPLANSLAVVVLIALIVTWFISLILTLMDVPISTNKGWYAWLLPICTVLGLPAVLGLIQTQGTTAVFAAIVLVVFVLNILVPILQIIGKSSHPLVNDWYKWAIPIIVLGGLVVASYMTFVESTGAEVSCGPVGNCNTVQHSQYAILFGILPVGVFGLAGYIAVLAGWVVLHFGPAAMRKPAALAIWGMCILGVLFSAYLTFLEPFVIGATCMWCISSAVLMIILLLVSTPAAQQAFAIEVEAD